METHEREYLVSQIVYGAKIIELRDLTLIIQPLTIEQRYFAKESMMRLFYLVFIPIKRC